MSGYLECQYHDLDEDYRACHHSDQLDVLPHAIQDELAVGVPFSLAFLKLFTVVWNTIISITGTGPTRRRENRPVWGEAVVIWILGAGDQPARPGKSRIIPFDRTNSSLIILEF